MMKFKNRLAVATAALMLATTATAHAVAQDTQAGSASAWAARADNMVEMARTLGVLHRLHQLCYPGDWRPDLYRDRMKEMVSLEEPYADLKEDMIAGFNEGYRTAGSSFERCERNAIVRMREAAAEGDRLAGQLAAPYRQISGYDYDAGGQ